MQELPHLAQEPEIAAQQYLKLRGFARETFQSFLRNLNSSSLRSIETTFSKNDGELDVATFLQMCPEVFPKARYEDFPYPEEHNFIVQLAGKMLFEDIDVDRSGGADWIEFVNFVCAVNETIRIQAGEGSAQKFLFTESQISIPYRPTMTKKLFDKLYYWPEHPSDNVIVFEEGQPMFHLQRHKTLQRRKRERIEGHRSDILAAAYLPDPYGWVVTAGNDKLLCWWDGQFGLVKKWKLDDIVGTLCWCEEINALYFADQNSDKLQAWRIRDPMVIRDPETKALRIDKSLTISTEHKKSITAILWLSESQCLATASLDTTVKIFDLIQMQHMHTFAGHTKGITCLEYCPALQLLLSAGFNNYITLWDPGAGVRYHTLKGHECSIIAICAVPDTDNEILSCDVKGVVKLWDLRRLACAQSFHAADLQAEASGETEALEPRALCALTRDRMLISGRKMVVFERVCSQPQLTADSPIMAIAFSHRKFEIVTTEKDNVRIWCALSGKSIAVHNYVIKGNITALTLGLGERRCFVGSDAGEICAINLACGAPLKTLTPHAHEVTQIVCIPEKILTLSTAEKLVRVHDDTNPEKAMVLKEIDLSHLEPIASISFNGEDIISGGTEDGDVVWLALTFAKQISSTAASVVRHHAPISSIKYFQSAPLVVSADSDSCVIFWSVQPLRPFHFFSKCNLELLSAAEEQVNSNSDEVPVPAITSMVLSWPDEDNLIVGTDSGTLACFCIKVVVQNARKQRDEILWRKDHGEAASFISGKIFESMPKPDDSPKYTYTLHSDWLMPRAHKGSIDQVFFTRLHRPVIISLGFDSRVCMWSPTTGEALGTLEQGLPEGLFYERVSTWNFPIDAHEQVRTELNHLQKAIAHSPEGSEHGKPNSSNGSSKEPSDGVESVAGPKEDRADRAQKKVHKSQSSPNMHLTRERDRNTFPDYRRVPSRLMDLPSWRQSKRDNEWLAGPFAPSFSKNPLALPVMQSGRFRPLFKENQRNEVVAAARRLSVALGALEKGTDQASRSKFL